MQKEEIVFITKSTGSLSLEEVINVFEGTEDLEIIKQAVESCGERVYASWASVDMKDLDGEVVPINDLIAQQDMLLNRNAPIIDNHSSRPIGQTMAYKILEHPTSHSTGLLHLNKIFNDGNQIDDQAWKEIKSGERKGSSIGGYNTGKTPGFDKTTGERADILQGFRQMETSSVYDPCNPLATNIAYAVVAKSNMNGIPRTDEERRERHNELYGEEPPKERMGQNKKLENQEMIIESDGKRIKAKVTYEEIEEDKPLDDKISKDKNKSDSVINKLSNIQDIINKTLRGDINMDTEKLETSLTEITKGIADISGRLTVLEAAKAKANDNTEDKPDEDPEEEKKKTAAKAIKQEEDKPKEDEKPKEEDEKPKEAKKEDAASEVEGNTGTEIADAPTPDTANEEAVFKKIDALSAKIEKKFSSLEKSFVAKASTPLPGQSPVNIKDDPMAAAPLDIALKGKVGNEKATWGSVHRAVKSQKQNMPTPFGGL